jgi:hypothetical protein
LGDFLQNANKTQISRNKFEDMFAPFFGIFVVTPQTS